MDKISRDLTNHLCYNYVSKIIMSLFNSKETSIMNNFFLPGIAYLFFYIFMTCQQIFAAGINAIDFPEEICMIQETHKTENTDKFVIFIQDIHTSYTAQKNLIKTLNILSAKHHINFIGIEGAAGYIDVSEIASFPDEKIKQMVMDYFLKTGEIHGSEYLAILSQKKNSTELWGIEDKSLYKLNLNSYICALNDKKQLNRYITMLNEFIDQLKQKLYSSELYQFDQMVDSCYQNDNQLVPYILNLVEIAQQYSIDYSEQSNIKLIQELDSYENQIDFAQVENEKKRLITQLKEIITEKEREDLQHNELLFKINQISNSEYFLKINTVLNKHQTEIIPDPNFAVYISYLSLSQKIDFSKLNKEIRLLENRIYDSLLDTPEQTKLYTYSQYISHLKNFVTLNMTRSSFADYSSSDINFTNVIDYIKQNVPDADIKNFSDSVFSDIEMCIAHFEEFYNLVHQRDKEMVSNFLNKMDDQHCSSGIIIAGGFHAEGIRENLKSNGISYITLLPSDDPDSERVPYLSLLKNLKSPLDKFFSAQTDTLKVASWLAHDPLAFQEKKPVLLAKIKTLLVTAKLFDSYKELMQSHPSVTDGSIVPENIGNTLRNMINGVIRKAGFDGLLEVSEVRPLINNLYAEIDFKDETGNIEKRLAVRFTKNTPEQHVGLNTTNDIIETITLSTGLTEEFLDYGAYNKIKYLDNKIQFLIFQYLTNQSATADQLETFIKQTIDVEIGYGEIAHYLDSFVEKGLLTKNQNTYHIAVSELTTLFSSLLPQLTQDYEQTNGYPDMVSIDCQSLPDSIVQNYPQVSDKLSAILLDANIPFNDLLVALSSIFQNIDDVTKGKPALQDFDTQLIELPGKSHALLRVSIASKPISQPTKLSNDYTALEFDFDSTRNTKIPVLNQHDLTLTEDDLIDLAQMGDRNAEETLINNYKPLIISIANNESHLLQMHQKGGSFLTFDDLLSQAREHFWKVLHYYRRDRGVKLSTFAYSCLRKRLKENISSSSWIKKTARKRIAEYNQAKEQVSAKLGKAASQEEVADYMGVSLENVNDIQALKNQGMFPLDAPLKKDSAKSGTFLDFHIDERKKTPEELSLLHEQQAILIEAIPFLDPRSQEIIEMNLKGINNTQIARIYGISRERVRQILEIEIIANLQKIIELNKYLSKEDLLNIKSAIEDNLEALSLREREVIILSHTTSLRESDIMNRLNFSDVDEFKQYKKTVESKFEKSIFSKPEFLQLQKLLKKQNLNWTMFIGAFLENREKFMLASIKDLFNRTTIYDVESDKLDKILSGYETFFSPLEQQCILMTQYEGLRLKDLAEILDINHMKAIWISTRLKNKLQAIVDLRSAFSDSTRSELSESFLEAFNSMTSRAKKVLIDLYYENISMDDIAIKLEVSSSTIQDTRKNILEQMRQFILYKMPNQELSKQITTHLNIESEYQIEQFLYGLAIDIPKDKIVLQRKKPDNMVEVYEAILHKQGEFTVNSDIKELLNIYARFTHPSYDKYLTEYYLCEFSSRQAAVNLDMNPSTYQPRLYMEAIPLLNEFVSFYQSFSPEELKELRQLAADAIETLPHLQKAMVIYFVYDDLSYDEIAKILELNTTNDYHRRRIVGAVRDAGKILLQNIQSEKIRKTFTPNKRNNSKYMNYFFCGLKYEIPRDYFHIPEVKKSGEKITYASEGVIQDFYEHDFLQKVYKGAHLKDKPDDLRLRILSTVLDRLHHQQINVLYFKTAKGYSRQEVADEMNSAVTALDSAQKSARLRIRKSTAFYKQFSNEELQYLHEIIASELEKLMVPYEYKALLIHFFYDHMLAKDAIEMLGIATKANESTAYQKTNTMKLLQEKVLEKLDQKKFKKVFELSTIEFDDLVFSMKATIPRERFGIPESPQGRTNANMKITSQKEVTPQDDNTSSVRNLNQQSTQLEVNTIFERLDTGSIDKLKLYLEMLDTPDFKLPNPVIVNRNPLFSRLRKSFQNAHQSMQYLEQHLIPMGLSYSEVIKLQIVLESCGYLKCDISDNDLIVLDIDSLRFYEKSPYTNMYVRKKLAHYMELVREKYRDNKRDVKFAIFSQTYNMAQIETLLGSELLSYFQTDGNQLFTKEFLPLFSKDSEHTDIENFMHSLLENSGLHFANIKMFSNNDDTINAASQLGFILADRDTDIYQALGIFSVIHPKQSKNLSLRKINVKISQLNNFKNAGYLALAGKEISNPPFFARKKSYNQLLEQSL